MLILQGLANIIGGIACYFLAALLFGLMKVNCPQYLSYRYLVGTSVTLLYIVGPFLLCIGLGYFNIPLSIGFVTVLPTSYLFIFRIPNWVTHHFDFF